MQAARIWSTSPPARPPQVSIPLDRAADCLAGLRDRLHGSEDLARGFRPPGLVRARRQRCRRRAVRSERRYRRAAARSWSLRRTSSAGPSLPPPAGALCGGRARVPVQHAGRPPHVHQHRGLPELRHRQDQQGVPGGAGAATCMRADCVHHQRASAEPGRLVQAGRGTPADVFQHPAPDLRVRPSAAGGDAPL
jgi:hypothetical protein